MKRKIELFAFVFIFLGLSYFAKAGTEPKWKASFTSEINWMKVTDVGTLVASTDDGIYGVNPGDGTIVWKNEELKKLNVEAYEPLSETPFIIITPGAKEKKGHAVVNPVAINKDYVLIINSLDGTVSCDTRKLGMSYLTGQFSLPELNAVIFVGKGSKARDKKNVTVFLRFFY